MSLIDTSVGVGVCFVAWCGFFPRIRRTRRESVESGADTLDGHDRAQDAINKLINGGIVAGTLKGKHFYN